MPAVLATTQGNIGWTIAIIIFIGFAIGVFLNMRKARPEIGSEIELAPNRKPYYDDDELETTVLDRKLFLGLLFLGVIAVALPLYWLYEPGRQAGAVKAFEETFIKRGERVYEEDAKCSECHGPKGVGGARETALLNENGDFVAQITWKAPALDTVLYRYSEEEVRYILTYGRPQTPMPAWGAAGGGPLTEQAIDNLIAYLYSIQLPADEWKTAVAKELEETCRPERNADGALNGRNPRCTADGAKFATYGEAVFNLGQYTGFAGGAASCGRCHTKGWSYGQPEVPGGGGALGFNLTNGSTIRQFPTAALQEEFVGQGSALGKPYGRGGMGSGQMPGFGLNPNAEGEDARMQVDQVMYTPEMIAAVVEYERGL
ncbi:MAG: cytochrome c [Acidimicrobiales bacterium]|nr:cytochrome c [Acidimicrobiales bacterium]